MSNKINIAQIGIGYWGPNLLRNFVSNKQCSVKIVVDKSEDRLNYVRNKYPDIKTYNNIDSILDNDNIDAVVISTPAKTHYDLAIACLDAGKHILVEKPMATTVDEIDNIYNKSIKYKLVAMAGHTYIYNNAVNYIKKLIDNGDLGEIRYIYCQRVNLGRIRDDIDAMWNLAPHDLSIIQYWLGGINPKEITKNGMSYVQKGIDDVVFLNIKYPNSILANIHVSWLDPNKIRLITIVGSKKMAVYNDIADDKIIVFDKGIDRMAILGKNMDFDNPKSFNFNYRSGDAFVPRIDWVEPLKLEVEHFIDCIINGRKCKTNPLHAKQVINILEKAN